MVPVSVTEVYSRSKPAGCWGSRVIQLEEKQDERKDQVDKQYLKSVWSVKRSDSRCREGCKCVLIWSFCRVTTTQKQVQAVLQYTCCDEALFMFQYFFTLQLKLKLYPQHLSQAVSALHSKGKYCWTFNRDSLYIALLIQLCTLLSFTPKVTWENKSKRNLRLKFLRPLGRN